MTRVFRASLCCGLAAILVSATAHAQDRLFTSGKLLLTGGVNTIEGAAGGGLAPWATIAGYGNNTGIGGNIFGTYVHLPDYSLRDYGAATGAFDRFEISYSRQEFDTG